MIWIILLVVMVIVITILLLSKVYILFKLEYTEENQILFVSIRFYGIQFLKRRIDLQDIEATDTWKNSFIGKEFKDILNEIHSGIKSFFNMVNTAQTAARIFLERLSVHKFTWFTCFGTGEASETGIAAGGIWTIKGILTGLFGNFSTFKCTPVIDVKPYFQHKYIDSKIDCIVSIRIGQAMYALIKVIRNSSIRKKEIVV